MTIAATTPAAAGGATTPAPTTTPATAAATTTPAAGTTTPAAQTAKPADAATTTTPADPAAAEKIRILRDRSALADEKKQLAEERKQHTALVEAQKSKNPTKVLQAAGFTADEIAKFLVNGAGTQASLEEKLTQTTKVVEELQTAEKTRADEARKAEEQAARAEVLSIVAEAKDTLPWVNALGQGDVVIAEMKAAAARGETPDFETTAKAVEAKLTANMPAYVQKMLGFPAVRALIEAEIAKAGKPAATPAATTTTTAADPAEKKDEAPVATGNWRRVGAKTLTNDLNQRASTPQAPQTPEEIWKELINRPRSS